MNNFASTYRRDSVLSMNSQQILLELYKVLLFRLEQAEEHLRLGNRAKTGTAISDALAIVSALSESLDRGSEARAVPLLDTLYQTVSSWLLEANLHQDARRIESSHRILATLKQGWDEAVLQNS